MNYQFFQFWGWRQRMSYGTSTGSYLKWQVPVQSCMQACCLVFGEGLYVFLCYHSLLLWLCPQTLFNCGPLQTKASAKCLAKCPRSSANPEAKRAIGPAAIVVADSIGTI